MTKSRAKSHVKDGPLRRKDVAIWKGGVGSNFVGPGSRFARLRGADPWRHGRGRVCLRPMDSDDRKCPAIVVNRCISLRQKLQPHGGMAARNYRKPSTSTSLIDVYLCAKNFNLMEAWPPGSGTIGNHRHRHRKLCAWVTKSSTFGGFLDLVKISQIRFLKVTSLRPS